MTHRRPLRVPVDGHRLLDHRLAGDELEAIAGRQHEGLHRLGRGENRRFGRHLSGAAAAMPVRPGMHRPLRDPPPGVRPRAVEARCVGTITPSRDRDEPTAPGRDAAAACWLPRRSTTTPLAWSQVSDRPSCMREVGQDARRRRHVALLDVGDRRLARFDAAQEVLHVARGSPARRASRGPSRSCPRGTARIRR